MNEVFVAISLLHTHCNRPYTQPSRAFTHSVIPAIPALQMTGLQRQLPRWSTASPVRAAHPGCCCRWDGSEGQPGVFESLLGHEEGRQELRAAPRALRSSQGKIYRYIYTGSIQYCKLYIG